MPESDPNSESDFELLQNNDTEDDNFSANFQEAPESTFEPAEFKRSDTVGPYKLLQQIGEGGMGTVWMAEQEKPVRRRVALKVIRGDKGSKESVARFEAERQALAMMDHQNIARVFDAGTTPQGNPFFVMELVKGIPITKYCDTNKLSIRKRLELIVPVCRAIQHAHQKGIIHRDLKPSNVLVTLYDGQAVPKVIDFGLAKALDHQQRLTDKTMFTEFGKVVGTLQYMSPEQAEMNALDVDTRTDIYSLGVMIYELLTGSTPLDKQTLKTNAFLKVLEIIREDEPHSPSIRLSSFGQQISDVSEFRNISPTRLQQLLKGELDWIVMKALEKDRTRRYETANGLAADIQRFLDDEPVTARPQSSAYRIQKFYRKNKGLVGTIASIVAMLIAGVAGTSIFAFKAEGARKQAVAERQRADEKSVDAIRERNRANQKSEETAAALTLAETARAEAEVSAKRASDILKIVTDSFETASPFAGADADISAKDVLLNARKILQESELDNEGKAILLRRLTLIFGSTGELTSAISTAEEELETLKKIDPDHSEIQAALYRLGRAKRQAGQYDESIEIFRDLIAFMDRNELPPKDTLRLDTMMNLGLALTLSGRNDDSIPILKKTLDLRSDVFGEGDQRTIDSMGALGMVLSKAGRDDDAIELFTKAIPIAKKELSHDHPTTLSIQSSLASAYHRKGDFDEALPRYQQLGELRSKKLGPTHLVTLGTYTNIAFIHVSQKRFKEGLRVYEETLAKQLTASEDHPQTLILQTNIVAALNEARLHIEDAMMTGDFETAEELTDVAISHQQHLNPALLPQLQKDACLAKLYCQKHQEVVTESEKWTQIVKQGSHEHVQIALAKIESLVNLKRCDEARAAAEIAIKKFDHPLLKPQIDLVLAICEAQSGNVDEAETLAVNSFSNLEKIKEEGTSGLKFTWYRKFACQRVIDVFQLTENAKQVTKWKSKLESITHELDAAINSRLTASEASEIAENIGRIAFLPPHPDTPKISDKEIAKLRQACTTFPTGGFLGTLALTEYRLGNYELAIEAALQSSPKLKQEMNHPAVYPATNAIIVASYREMGNTAKATELTQKVLDGMKLERFIKDAECREIVTQLIPEFGKIEK